MKANISAIETNKIKRQDSLCSITILNKAITVFTDTHRYPALLASPYVSDKNGIRFYAGAPIVTHEGYHIGTVCVIDEEPRSTVSEKQLNMLKMLSDLTLEKLESRLAHRINVNAYDDRMHRLVHDLKNPITSILAYSQIIASRSLPFETQSALGSKIESSSRAIEQSLNNILEEASNDNGVIDLKLEIITFEEIAKFIKSTFESALANKSQTLEINCDGKQTFKIDRRRIEDALTNLMSNAIKYSHVGSVIYINCYPSGADIIIEFKDNGVGLSEEDLSKLFIKFAKLSSIPTGNERSNGLGLSIVKMLVELHKGKVWATSEGKNKGSSFFISFPALKPVGMHS